MRILSQIAPPRKVRREDTESNSSVRRRIEITVERESVSLLVPGRRQDSGSMASKDFNRESKIPKT